MAVLNATCRIPVSTVLRFDLVFISCVQKVIREIVHPYIFSKTFEKSRKYGKKFEIRLEMIGRKPRKYSHSGFIPDKTYNLLFRGTFHIAKYKKIG